MKNLNKVTKGASNPESKSDENYVPQAINIENTNMLPNPLSEDFDTSNPEGWKTYDDEPISGATQA